MGSFRMLLLYLMSKMGNLFDKIKEDYVRFALAFTMLLITAYYADHVTFHKTTLSDTLVGAIIGYFVAQVQTVFNFYFGSSSGSLEKTRALTHELKNGHP